MIAAANFAAGDWAAIAGIAGAPMALVALYLRSLRSELLTAQASMAKRIDAHEREVGELRTEMRERADKLDADIRLVDEAKAGRKDWLREVMTSRAKLDRIGEEVAAVSAKLDTQFGVGAAVNKLADTLGRMVETKPHG